MQETLVVNLFAGPGTGKSTIMADLFSRLKWAGVNCEMAPEFVKEVVWENRPKPLDNQVYILGKQYYRIKRLIGEVDIIITDSPLLFSSLYRTPDLKPSFDVHVRDLFNSFNNINFFLRRVRPYNPSGRLQNLEEARELDQKILTLLNEYDYKTVDGSPDGVDIIAENVLGMWKDIPYIREGKY